MALARKNVVPFVSSPMVAQEMGRQRRRIRRPQHSFYVSHRPYVIQPTMIAPVWPGETMRNLVLQSRAVSQPLVNPLMGWWLEHYFFYVSHMHLPEHREALQQMMLQPAWSPSVDAGSLYVSSAATVPEKYFPGAGLDWVGACVDRIAEEYFRDEGEIGAALDGLPLASISRDDWMHSAILDSEYSQLDVELYADDQDTPGSIMASHVEETMRQYEVLRAMGLVEMTYEDWLRTYGVNVPSALNDRPELIRYVREWTYPTNTIDPSTGVPRSAVSWSVQERADKDRFFREPGFVVGLTVARPKVYLANQAGAAAWNMRDPMSWLPAILRADYPSRYRQYPEGSGPLKGLNPTGDNAFWFDIADLAMYGDQFVGGLTASQVWPPNKVSLPTATLQRRYALETDIEALFVGSGAADHHLQTITQDGIVTLMIASALHDVTPRVHPAA